MKQQQKPLLERWNVVEAFERMKKYTEQMLNNWWKLWYKSPYKELDEFTSGIIPWKVYTIAWYSNVWKSRFTYPYVNHFLDIWKKVLFFSLEVDKWLFIQHLCCNRYNKYQSDLKETDIDVMDYSNLSIYDDVYRMDDIEFIINETKWDVVFIDFVQNIQYEKGSEYERMSYIARKIQELAILNNITIISLSQLSNTIARDVTKGNTDFVALKWAWEFVASSDVIFLLRMVDNWMGLTITKNKFGRRPWWEIYFQVDFWKSKFEIVQDPFRNKEIF